MNDNNSKTIYDLILSAYESRFSMIFYGTLAILISLLANYFWLGETKYTVWNKISKKNDSNFTIGSEIHNILLKDGFNQDYIFEQLYIDIKSNLIFIENMESMKNDLISKHPEVSSEIFLDIIYSHHEYQFVHEAESKFNRSNILVSTITGASNLDMKTFIINNHIDFTSKKILEKLFVHYKSEELNVINKIAESRENHKEKIINEIDREIYKRDTIIKELEFEFAREVSELVNNITVAKLMGIVEPDYTSQPQSLGANFIITPMDEYLYGVKILEKKLENLKNSRSIVINDKIKKHQIIIDSYEKTFTDAFIPDMNNHKIRLRETEKILRWLTSQDNIENKFFEFNKIYSDVKKFGRNKLKLLFITTALGLFFGYLIHMFRVEQLRRNNNLLNLTNK